MSVLRRLPMPRPTPLQESIVALHDVILDARDSLEPRAYEAFVAIGCEIVGSEAGRLFLGRLLHRERAESEAA